jgi:hypothetical protein
MLELLLTEKFTSTEIARELEINHNSTFFKYKSMLQLDTNLPLKATDEIMYLKNRNKETIEEDI